MNSRETLYALFLIAAAIVFFGTYDYLYPTEYENDIVPATNQASSHIAKPGEISPQNSVNPLSQTGPANFSIPTGEPWRTVQKGRGLCPDIILPQVITLAKKRDIGLYYIGKNGRRVYLTPDQAERRKNDPQIIAMVYPGDIFSENDFQPVL